MIIDDAIVRMYLQDADPTSWNRHWLFHHIEENQYLFEAPLPESKSAVAQVHETVLQSLSGFTPLNAPLFRQLFPDYLRITEEISILLVVGCPQPYDAMVRTYLGKEYVIFDLVHFAAYMQSGSDLRMIARKMLTHEFAHTCLHEKYTDRPDLPYVARLNYIAFDEGFAHYLSFGEDIAGIDFSSAEYSGKYASARAKLKDALQVDDPQTQAELLISSNSGPYWEKFAAISGFLYLANHPDRLLEIYYKGWEDFTLEI